MVGEGEREEVRCRDDYKINEIHNRLEHTGKLYYYKFSGSTQGGEFKYS